MILLSRKKQIEILDKLRSIATKRDALDILQKYFNLSLFELILYIKDTKEYAVFIKKNSRVQNSKYFHDDNVVGVREEIMNMYNNQISINQIANTVKLDTPSVNRHLTSLRRAGLVGINKKKVKEV